MKIDLNQKTLDEITDGLKNTDHSTSLLVARELFKRGHSVTFPFWPNKTMLVTIGNSDPFLLKGLCTKWSSDVARRISVNKRQAYRWAEYIGLPVVPYKTYVKDVWALKFWKDYDGNVVLKPITGQQGQGVRVNFRDSEDFLDSIHEMTKKGGVLMQRKSRCRCDLRLLFIDGKFVAATLRNPASIVGDGESTLQELIMAENNRRIAVNKDPKRIYKLKPIKLEEALRVSGHDAEYIPLQDEVIQVSIANISAGGTSEDVTDKVHDSYKKYGKTLAESLDTPVVSVDFYVNDPSVDELYPNGDACFLETNVMPSINLQQQPDKGPSRDVASAFVNYLEKQCKY